MLFNSYSFLIFFPIVVLITFIIPKKWQYIWLLIASYFFYMNWDAKYVLLLLASTAITYLSGIALERVEQEKHAKAVATVSFLLNLLLPVGISFYIFQVLSYTVDVYRKDVKTEKNFLRYALFVSFFPQLVEGPIERSKNLLKQVNEVHSSI